MKITLVVTGKTDSEWLKKGIDVYWNRLRHYASIEMKVLPDLKNTRNMPEDLQREKEGQQIIACLDGKNDTYLLDEGGQHFSSREFSRFIERKMIAGSRELTFVIGGPFGFSEQVTRMATGKISLSRLTFSHQMVRLLFAEQLYRAFTIIRGESYHND
ncbi:MAG: 23S rRNA (pseudouridine(1915)-N(3))-methyltransferase RlmH [Bacteroidota bacterium]